MKIITFFSYKGGAGRTVAAANIAAAMASQKGQTGAIAEPLDKKVALLDLDVFSAGTHRVFKIENKQINERMCIQDYLLNQISPEEYIETGRIECQDTLMEGYRRVMNAQDNCRDDFALFPAKVELDKRFLVQKQHENLLLELFMELEDKGYDYIILDGESGVRSMADTAIRLADVIVMLFRLTWQHIEGTIDAAQKYPEKFTDKPFYLIPTVVPLVGLGQENTIYKDEAPGIKFLINRTDTMPTDSDLDEYSNKNKFINENPLEKGPGYFWAEPNRICIHDSLFLKGEERVYIYEADARNERAAHDYYQIAKLLCELHPTEK
jgi:cellulose biosynthesis protein BcsQ